MAMFRKQKFDDLEENFSEGKEFNVDNHVFKLTLHEIIPSPNDILLYDWNVTLPDGNVLISIPMAPNTISYPPTRLEIITNKLKEIGRDTDDYLANAINDAIDEVFRTYR